MSTYTPSRWNPLIMLAYIRALKFHPRCGPIHEIGKRIAHFTKWADVGHAKLREMGNTLVYFVK